VSRSILHRIVRTHGWAPVVLRTVAGTIFAAHGAQELFGWFGGHGLDGAGQWMEKAGLLPGYPAAVLAASAEFLGGLALILGLMVRPACAVLTIVMAAAIVAMRFKDGLITADNGYEFGLSLLIISVSLLLTGAGRASVDHAVQRALAHHRQPA
jgi:putative oxidoreductase